MERQGHEAGWNPVGVSVGYHCARTGGACWRGWGRVRAPTPAAATAEPASYGTGDLMAADPSGGYWTATATGALVPHGGAPQLGNPAASGVTLNKPIVGMAAPSTVTDTGWWPPTVASSPTATPFFGSTGSIHLNKPIVGMAPTPDGAGYWMVASDGGIFSYGDAPSSAPPGRSTSTSPSWAWHLRSTVTVIGSRPPTVASSPTATRPSTGRPDQST